MVTCVDDNLLYNCVWWYYWCGMYWYGIIWCVMMTFVCVLVWYYYWYYCVYWYCVMVVWYIIIIIHLWWRDDRPCVLPYRHILVIPSVIVYSLCGLRGIHFSRITRLPFTTIPSVITAYHIVPSLWRINLVTNDNVTCTAYRLLTIWHMTCFLLCCVRYCWRNAGCDNDNLPHALPLYASDGVCMPCY